MFFDQLDVISRDLIVIIFQFGEGFFMVFHQLINVQILSFFQLMNFYS